MLLENSERNKNLKSIYSQFSVPQILLHLQTIGRYKEDLATAAPDQARWKNLLNQGSLSLLRTTGWMYVTSHFAVVNFAILSR